MSSSSPATHLSQSYIDESIGDKLTNTAIAFIVLDTLFMALRCWSRCLQKASIGWDDILIVPAYITCLGLSIAAILAAKYGAIGQHFDAVIQSAPEKLEYWGHSMLLATPILYGVSSTLPKLVILAVYLRIFVQKWVRIGCHIIGATLVAACVINVILFLWQCSPIDYVWNKTISHGYCRDDIEAHIRWGQLPNIVTDIAMLILPLPVVWKLQVPRKVKIGLTATFAVGSLGLITATIRFVEFLSTAAFNDATWNAVKLTIWSCVESGVYLIAACLLACRPLLHHTLHAGLFSRVWSQITRFGNYSDFTDASKTKQEIELQMGRKQAYKSYRGLDDDLEALDAGSRSDGNLVQASGQRDIDSLQIPADMDRIHVKREIRLQSNEQPKYS